MMSYSRLIKFSFCLSVLSYCLTNSAAATSSDICSKLSNHEGIYLVYPNGKPMEITKTIQHAKYDRGVAVYFVIDAVADQSERVDHYRILSTSQEKVDEFDFPALRVEVRHVAIRQFGIVIRPAALEKIRATLG